MTHDPASNELTIGPVLPVGSAALLRAAALPAAGAAAVLTASAAALLGAPLGAAAAVAAALLVALLLEPPYAPEAIFDEAERTVRRLGLLPGEHEDWQRVFRAASPESRELRVVASAFLLRPGLAVVAAVDALAALVALAPFAAVAVTASAVALPAAAVALSLAASAIAGVFAWGRLRLSVRRRLIAPLVPEAIDHLVGLAAFVADLRAEAARDDAAA